MLLLITAFSRSRGSYSEAEEIKDNGEFGNYFNRF